MDTLRAAGGMHTVFIVTWAWAFVSFLFLLLIARLCALYQPPCIYQQTSERGPRQFSCTHDEKHATKIGI